MRDSLSRFWGREGGKLRSSRAWIAIAGVALGASVAVGGSPVDVQQELAKSPCGQTRPCVYFEYGFGRVLDGFSGTYKRQLAEGGDTTIAFSLPDEDLWEVLALADSVGFFSFPDTVQPRPDLRFTPDPSPDTLRLLICDRDHTVVWYYPIDSSWPQWKGLLRLAESIDKKVESSEEIRELPPPVIAKCAEVVAP
jgi:hypothetical protein